MKILQIHTSLQAGGIESFIASLANELSKSHDVTVCTIFEPKDTDIFYQKLSRRIKRISLGKKEKGFSLREIWKIYLTIANGNYDVVHLHGCFYYYMFAIFALYKRVKFIYTIHSDAERENISWDKHFFAIKKFAFRHNLMHAVTISPRSQKSFEQLYPHTANRMIFNGIEIPQIEHEDKTSRYRTTRLTKLFLHAGRITEAKNQLALCKVFSKLIAEGEDIALLICGKAEDMSIFRQIEPYFSDRIIYLGERNDVATLMSQCEALCLPSIWEGLPITVLEAMSVGCIPICSPVGGITDVIEDGISGYISASPSEEDYTTKFREFLNTHECKINQIKHNAQRQFKKYDIAASAAVYVNYYSEHNSRQQDHQL